MFSQLLRVLLLCILFLSIYAPAAHAVKRVLDKGESLNEHIIDGPILISIAALSRDRNMLSVMLIKNKDVRGRQKAVTQMMFQGECTDVGEIIVTTSEVDTPAYSRFQSKPGAGTFPFPLELQKMQKALSYQCPVMRSMVVSFAYHPKGQSRGRNVETYTATLSASNHWQLGDGVAMGTERPISIRFRAHEQGPRGMSKPPINYNIGADHRGFCEGETKIALSPFSSAQAHRGAPNLSDYKWAAGQVTRLYLQECPDAQVIHFSLNPKPHDYSCGKPCVVRTSKAGRWGFEMQGSGLQEISRAGTMSEVLGALEGGRFEEVSKDHLFKVFYFRYLSHYSAQCRAQIKDPVPFEFSVTTKTVDGYGHEQYSVTEALPNKVYVERRYSGRFGAYYQSYNAQGMVDFFALMSRAKGRGAVPSAGEMHERLTRGDRAIQSHLRQGCNAPAVKAVYENLYRHAH